MGRFHLRIAAVLILTVTCVLAHAADEPIVPTSDVALPTLLSKTPPIYPDAMRRDGITGRVVLQVEIRADGTVGQIRTLKSTRFEFEAAAHEAVREWRYRPATIDGKPVGIWFTVNVTFDLKDAGKDEPPHAPAEAPPEPAARGVSGSERSRGNVVLPMLVERVTPAFPDAMRKKGKTGRVILEAVVRTDGTVGDVEVKKASEPEFNEAAIDAVKQWRYRPAMQDGKPVQIRYTVRVDFALADSDSDRRTECFGRGHVGPVDDPDTPPELIESLTVPLPPSMETTGGAAEVDFVVCRDGSVDRIAVQEYNNRVFAHLIEESLRMWRFRPAMKAGEPVAVKMTKTITVKPVKPDAPSSGEVKP